MNTQTFAQAQNIAPITDEELMAATGGGIFTVAFKTLGGGNRVTPARILNQQGPGPQIG